jgi:hypothetical protein
MPWGFASNGSGTTAGIKVGTAANPGIVTMTTGSTNTGQAGIYKGDCYAGNGFGNSILGGGVYDLWFVMSIGTLSTGIDEFQVYFGIGDGFEPYQTSPGSNGCIFRYIRTTSVNWQGVTLSGGSTTVASGGSNVAVATGFHNFRISINAAASSVSFYVNGTLIGTSAANISTSVPISIGACINKTVGTNSRNLDWDYVGFYNQLTTSRF